MSKGNGQTIARIPTLGVKRYAGPRDPSFWISGFRQAMGHSGMPGESPVKYNVWVSRALSTIATNLSQVPFVLKRGPDPERLRCLSGLAHERAPGIDKARSIEAGPWYDLFENPNPLITGTELWQFTSYQMSDVPGGSSYWILESGEDRELGPTEIPKEIWPEPKKVMTPVFSEDGRRIIGYIVEAVNRNTSQLERMAVSAHNVVHHRYVDPTDLAGSMSPLQAAASGIRQDFQASAWNEAFFRNDATPGLLLTTKDPLNEDQREANRKEWERLHRGSNRSHRAAILEGGLTAQVIGASHTEMGFMQLRQWNREEISAATGVPLWFMGVSSDYNYATAKSAERILWSSVLMPLAKMIARNLDFQLFRARDPLETRSFWRDRVPALGSAEVWGEFDTTTVEALRADLSEKLGNASQLRALSYPMNEINKVLALGMEPQEHGDVCLIQGGWMPVEDAINPVSGDIAALFESDPDDGENPADDGDREGSGDKEGMELPDEKDRPRPSDDERSFGGMPGAAMGRGNVKRREEIWRTMVLRVFDPNEKLMRAAILKVLKTIRNDVQKAVKDQARAFKGVRERSGTITYDQSSLDAYDILEDGVKVGEALRQKDNTFKVAIYGTVLEKSYYDLGEAKLDVEIFLDDYVAPAVVSVAEGTVESVTEAEVEKASDDLATRLSNLREKWQREMVRLGKPVTDKAASAGLNELDAQLPTFISVDVRDPEVVVAISENTRRLKGIPDGVAEFMRLSLAKGYAEGETLDELSARVDQTIKTAGNYSSRIARDEVSHAVNSVRNASMKALDHVTGAEWISSRDGKVRETHSNLDGQVRAVDGRYPNVSNLPGGALRYPQDPAGPDKEVKGCRCVEAPVVEF